MQRRLKVNVYLVADSLEKRGGTHVVQTLQVNPHTSESFPLPGSLLSPRGIYSALQHGLENHRCPPMRALAGNKSWGNQSDKRSLT